MKNILGLDLGTNSIGWSLIKQDFDKKEGQILGLGSRIIPMDAGKLGDFDKGNPVSQTAERTGFRGTRRLRERNLLRRERLHRVLNILGFLPEHFSRQIDFEKRLGQFKENLEPKIAYKLNLATNKMEFLFLKSFEEMLKDFTMSQPALLEIGKKIPHDWTIYYLRKKALKQQISNEELAWLLLHFNQKRGYYQLRGEDAEEDNSKLVEFHSLLVVDVLDSGEKKSKDEIWYNVLLENGWIYRRTSKTPLDWKGKTKEFIVTTDLDENGKIRKDKEGKEKRSFRSPSPDDWTLVKKKTEYDIDKSQKTVGAYIYDSLLQNPNQKIKGKLVRTIERKFYKEELKTILDTQKKYNPALQNSHLYKQCIEELYPNNEPHKSNIGDKGFTHLFLNDIIFYQRPLKSKKSLISNCKFESRSFKDKDGSSKTAPLKCIAKSHPLYQEFRLWQFIQNLKIYQREKEVNGKLTSDVNITDELLPTEEDKVNLFEWLNDRKEIDQKAFLKYPKFGFKKDTEKYRWNYVEDKIYPCNETRAQILSKLSKVENVPDNFLNQKTEETLWHILYSVEDKIEIEKALNSFAKKYQLGEDFIEIFKKFKPFDKEYGAYSAKAIKKLLPLIRIGHYWNVESIDLKTTDRIEKILTGEFDENIRTRVREKAFRLNNINDFKGLPLWLTSYIVYDRHSEDADGKQWKTAGQIELLEQHSLRNPIVEQVINETLQVVRDIWIKYGNGEKKFFDEIHIELGREMKNPADKRKRMTSQITENENTNLRIKALLAELLNDEKISNVRPYSPSQQEILKIYEEGALLSENNIPEDILKISKNAQPNKSELIRYKLWLEQKYRSPYTGEMIPLGKLFTPNYEIEHIIPQSRYFDDSFSNKVICESEVNKDKSNCLGYEYIKANRGKKLELSGGKEVKIFTIEEYEDFVRINYNKNRSKMNKLLMEEIPESFIQRQLNDSRYISKVVKNLLSNIVREDNEQETTSKNVIACTGAITSILKQDWGLNDVWNEIITPRFERLNTLTKSANFGEWTNKDGKKVFQTRVPLELQKGFNKKRIDHRHHALDALVIACATRNHINYLNNQNSLDKGKTNEEKDKLRYDLKQNLCFKNKTDDKGNYKWQFHKPWNNFTLDAKDTLQTTIISFKPNLRVINKTANRYQVWKKDEDGKLIKGFETQTKGNWAIRKSLHKDTVFGSVNLRFVKTVKLAEAIQNTDMIVDKSLRLKINELASQNYDSKALTKYFKDIEYKWNGEDISKVELYYLDTDNVASRVSVDESFGSKKIESVTDTGIQKILFNHLANYNEIKGNKITEHPELAFSPDGLDVMNKNITALNEGKYHHPIYKVRTYEPKGNKFKVGTTGNKKDKYVEAAKGTNLFFAIYKDAEGKRNYDTIPLNEVIERMKQGLAPAPEKNKKGDMILFHLSPNDLVYVPTEEEIDNPNLVDYNLNKEQTGRVYKMVSSSGNQCFFIGNIVSTPIINKVEFSALNKTEKSIDDLMIKSICWKLTIDRLGKITKIIKIT